MRLANILVTSAFATACAPMGRAVIRTDEPFGPIKTHKSALIISEVSADDQPFSRSQVMWRKGQVLDLQMTRGLRIFVTPTRTLVALSGYCTEVQSPDVQMHDVMLVGVPSTPEARRL